MDVGERLGIPVYMYESAARFADRRNLENIRKGGYEGLRQRIEDWRPDYGPTEFDDRVRKSGATVIGARFFLIAYNINLKTKDVRIAQKIARTVRESGALLKDEAGKERKVPGLLKYVKAIGVELKEYHITQVSINLTNYEETSIHQTYETVKKLAKELGTEATGSEIIGLVPEKALIDAGIFYTDTQSKEELIAAAIENLGLSQLHPFEPAKKIVEYLL
jgi:glutamate formiminotransferase/formiminotetrahydrofolate cyclodeaminase